MKRVFTTQSVRRSLAVAAVLATLSFTVEANAGWYTKYSGGGGSSGGSTSSGSTSSSGDVPEFDAGSAAGALTLLFGGVMLMCDKYGLRKQRCEENA